MILTASLIVLVLLAGAAYAFRSRRSRPAPSRQPSPRASEQFASVEIRRINGACAASRKLEGQRFLAKQAPALPLVGCTKTRCDCAFTKLSDRRTDDRRWGHEGLGAAMFVDAERRNRAGRRDAD